MITGMQKLLLVGPAENKEKVLSALQRSGVVEVESYKGSLFPVDGREVSTVRADLIIWAIKTVERYAAAAERTGLTRNDCEGDPATLVDRIPVLDREHRKCREETVQLQNKLNFIAPWGDFLIKDIREIEQKGNVFIQLWDVAQKVAHEVKIEEAIAEIEIFHDNERKYFMTFAAKPLKIKQCIEVNYDTDPVELRNEISSHAKREVEILQELLNISSRKNDLYKYYFQELNRVNFNKAAGGSVHEFNGRIFLLQAWCPLKDLEELKKVLENETVTAVPIEPEKDERIPTLMEPKKVSDELGGDLVNIYDTPSYKDWDPSSWVFFAFTIFFAMIMADGGYGLLLLVVMIVLKIKVKKPAPAIKRFINLSMVLSGATFFYGVFTGGFFGFSLSSPAFKFLEPFAVFLKNIRLLNTEDTPKMMLIAIVIGMIHICTSLILRSFRAVVDEKDYIAPLINIAWIAGIWSFFFWYKYDGVAGAEHLTTGGMLGLKIVGGVLVVLYAVSARTINPLKMFMTSFFGLYNGVQFFSDILSYIRIFALGLSGALLAQTFNNLAFDLWNTGIAGMIFAPIIFVLGHTLNIALCIMGGVIHGLRLNFLEWYRWSFDGGGKRFVPFKDLLKTYVNGEN
ncbi:MAG TPA: V-type ATPase 116kDa subunit family protein [bacterium]|nr:V-type ATPase 116kDa subunit family protein [bacterium]